MKVEIWSDVACPWCYVGDARLQRALERFPGRADVEVVYRPFQLDPAAPARGVPLLEHLERRYGAAARSMAERVSESARGEGIEMDFGRALAVNTLPAHRLLRLAEREHGPAVQRAVATGLFRAHFSEGRDVGDPAVLAAVAAAAGMDAARVRAYLAADEGRREVEEEIGQARRLGITAVPTFVFEGRYAVQGAQPASAFLQALEAVEQEAAEQQPEGADGEACADGACGV